MVGQVLLVLVIVMVQTYTTEASSCNTKSNTTCSTCVRDFDCYWCVESKFCGDRPTIKPSSKECDGKWFSYSQCTVNGNLLLIIVPIVLVVVLFLTVCCIYCCCCRQCCRERRQRKWAKEDTRKEARKNDRSAKHEARAEEMKIKHDNIRKKYGLFKDDQYERFDAS